MRVVAPKRRTGVRGEEIRPDWSDDDPTTVSPIAFIEEAASADVISSAEQVPSNLYDLGVDDTVFDDRSEEEIALAIGTGDKLWAPSVAVVPSSGSGRYASNPHAPAPGQLPPPAPPPQQVYATAYPTTSPFPLAPYPTPAAYAVLVPSQQGWPMQPTGPFPTAGSYAQIMAPPRRSSPLPYIITGFAFALTAAIGVVIGKFVVEDQAPPAAVAPSAPVTAPAAAAATPAPVPTAPATPTAADAAAAAPAAMTLSVTSLASPESAQILAPAAGVVTRSTITAPRAVHKGETLFEISGKASGGGKAKELAARIKELEKLADKDPVYNAFLDKARKDYKRAQPRSTKVEVKAQRDETLQPKVARGDRVEAEQALAATGDAQVWVATASLSPGQKPQPDWSCAIAVGDQHGACTIEKVEDARVTVRVEARLAPWLRAKGQEQTIVLGPPGPR
jgi:biotin carboxyl carrier protein